MKTLNFNILEFEAQVEDNHDFRDMGYSNDLLKKAKEFNQEFGLPSDDESLMALGFKPFFSGFCFHHFDKKTGIYHSRIVYTPDFFKVRDLSCRAHEEAHAVCFHGLRPKLTKEMLASGYKLRSRLSEEDFCGQAGLWVLNKRGLEPEPFMLIPYKIRFEAAAKRFSQNQTTLALNN